MKKNIFKMKQTLLAVVLSLLSFCSVFAQAETAKIKDGTISNSAEKAKPGSIFELESNSKGMLVSRLTTAQRDAIPTANLSNGLLVYNINSNCFDYWDSLRIQWLSMCGTPPPAIFTISPAQCSAIVVNGTYKQGEVLTPGNYLTVSVTVTQPGTYAITATTANGYYFETAGSFPSANTYEIILKGTGRPNSGYDVGQPGDAVAISLNGVSNSCSPNIYVAKANVDYSITCATIGVKGTYNLGLDLVDTNMLSVDVNVTNLGFWSIKTNVVNGYSFNGSGTFTTTGVQTVQLLGTGRPIDSGINNFNISSNATTQAGAACSGVAISIAPVAYTMNCASAVQAGTYMQSIALTNNNTITLPINVTSTGKTTISTNTVNGISFTTGPIALTALGTQNVILIGSGTPTTGTTAALTITGAPGAVSTCGFDLVISAQPVAYAMNCGGITTSGNYIPGTAMAAQNTMTVSVTPTYVGNYTISTNTINGVSFSGAGTFTNTSAQSVVLKASGTPLKGGTFTYMLTSNSSSGSTTCSKDVSFMLRKINVLGIGQYGSTPVYQDKNYSARGIVSSPSNFGNIPQSIVQMDGFNFVEGAWGVGSGNLQKLINDNNIDVIFIGHDWSYNETSEMVQTLVDFVKNKKGVLIHGENYEGTINKNNGIAIIQALYGNTYGTLADIERKTATTITATMATSSDAVISGPFRDVKGLNFALTATSSVPLYLKNIPSGVTPLVTKNGDATRVLAFRDNTLGYAYFGDDYWSNGYVTYANQTQSYAMQQSSTGAPASKPWGSGANSFSATDNAFLYANLMAWAVQFAQANTVTTYQVH